MQLDAIMYQGMASYQGGVPKMGYPNAGAGVQQLANDPSKASMAQGGDLQQHNTNGDQGGDGVTSRRKGSKQSDLHDMVSILKSSSKQ